MTTAPDWNALRQEFPTLQRWTYLDSARKTIPPLCQARAMQEERAQIVNVLVPQAEHVMNALREKHNVIVNVKDDAIRISMGFFNTEEDLEKAVSAIARETRGAKVAAA